MLAQLSLLLQTHWWAWGARGNGAAVGDRAKQLEEDMIFPPASLQAICASKLESLCPRRGLSFNIQALTI